jgi:hypothetical protein|tara:strand:- start:624 stop:791 length:168 start_codon:yes stop_codon:yes gene_type:complete
MSNILFFEHIVKTNKLKGLTLNCLSCGDQVRFVGTENVLEEVYFCEHCHYPINID